MSFAIPGAVGRIAARAGRDARGERSEVRSGQTGIRHRWSRPEGVHGGGKHTAPGPGDRASGRGAAPGGQVGRMGFDAGRTTPAIGGSHPLRRLRDDAAGAVGSSSRRSLGSRRDFRSVPARSALTLGRLRSQARAGAPRSVEPVSATPRGPVPSRRGPRRYTLAQVGALSTARALQLCLPWTAWSAPRRRSLRCLGIRRGCDERE